MAKDNNEYYLYTDPYRTKDLIWDAYNGFVTHYNTWKMYKHLNRSKGPHIAGLVKNAVFMFEEIDCFLDKLYPDKEDRKIVNKIREIFDPAKIKFPDDQIMIIRRFFNNFMYDSGIKNIMNIKDTRSPVKKLLAERYPDLNQEDEVADGEEKST